VIGRAGSGKTNWCSREYVLRWFTFTSDAHIANNMEESPPLIYMQNDVLRVMNKTVLLADTKFLFIYDGIDDIENTARHILVTRLPDNVTVIITLEDYKGHIPDHWQIIDMPVPDKRAREHILNAEINPIENPTCKEIVKKVLQRDDAVLPLELSLVAAFVNNYKLVSETLKEAG